MTNPNDLDTAAQLASAKLDALLAGRDQFQADWARATNREQLLGALERLRFVEDKPGAQARELRLRPPVN